MKKFLLLIATSLALTSCLTNSEYPTFTQCLNDNHIVMFGASWCPHCAAQKQLFGRSVSNMPYYECSENGKQVQACDDRGIMSYPTWQFQEPTLSTLPKEAMTNLLNGEIDKVRSVEKTYTDGLKDKPDLLKVVSAYHDKTEKLIASDISDFDKLKKLTVLSDDATGLVEKPVYIAGRIAGERTLADIALYSGCSAQYQADTSVATK